MIQNPNQPASVSTAIQPDEGRAYTRKLWIGTAPYEALIDQVAPGLELVRHGSHGFWAVEAGMPSPRLLLLTQAMTRDADVIRGLSPAVDQPEDTQKFSGLLEASAQTSQRPGQAVFATATDLREWLSAPIWSRTLSTRDEHLIAHRTLPAPDHATGRWAEAAQELGGQLAGFVAQGARLEAVLKLEGTARTQEIIRKPLLTTSRATPKPMALSA